MPGKVIGIQTGYGYPGQISRQPHDIVRTRPVIAGGASIYFGDPIVLNSDGSVKRFDNTGTAATFAGVATRRVKSAFIYPDQSLAFYMEKEPCDVILRGCVSVHVKNGTPTTGGKVYIRTALNAAIPAGIIGGFEAAADGTNSVEITNCKWGTNADVNGVSELVILTQQSV